MLHKQLVVIGGGPAGLAAALEACRSGIPADQILVIERDVRLGGILNQCIHNGFGLHTFKEELTGPEYAARYIELFEQKGLEAWLDTMVLSISQNKVITCVSPARGICQIQAQAIILAMGCRERPRGALNIPGYRPAGIFSAGTAQKLVNLDGFMPGKDVVILGSGDIGLIMARRMILEGARVHAVAELMPYSAGLKRNIVQCLNDYNIPLLLSHTVVDIQGKERVEGVTIAEVDGKGRPIAGTEITYPCDTLLLSCGLIPENELSLQAGIELSPATKGPLVDECLMTRVPGIFACGNVLHVHDLVDFVSQEASKAGLCAARYILQQEKQKQEAQAAKTQEKEGSVQSTDCDSARSVPISTGGLVRYSVPAHIHPERLDDDVLLRFRVANVARNARINVFVDGKKVLSRKKMIMVPAEMEQVILKKEWISPDTQEIRLESEEACDA